MASSLLQPDPHSADEGREMAGRRVPATRQVMTGRWTEEVRGCGGGWRPIGKELSDDGEVASFRPDLS